MSKTIPTDRHITYQLQYRRCGKPHCRTCQRSKGHGPYVYAYWRDAGKMCGTYVGKATADNVALVSNINQKAQVPA